MSQESQPQAGAVDISIPSVARMYDYYLGGKDNYAVDREACEELSKVVPSTQVLAINNRRFLQRVVRWLAREHGIRQFIDHGSGLPTQDNVHQVAQQVDPESRVVYVDNDPIVLAHGRALLEENENTAVIQADMRDTDGIFGSPEVERLIDFDRARRRAVRLGPPLHPRCRRPGRADQAGRRPARARQLPGDVPARQRGRRHPRLRHRIHGGSAPTASGAGCGRPMSSAGFLEGLEIQEPGLVEVSTWKPDADIGPKQLTQEWIEFGGVARKV